VRNSAKMACAVALPVTLSATLALAGGFAGYTDPVRWPVGLNPTDVQTADLDGDAHADLLITNIAGRLTTLRGVGDGAFVTLGVAQTIAAPKALALGDFNGDHHPDAAVVSATGLQLAIHLNQGDGTFGSASLITLSAFADAVVSGDFNGDGRLDLYVSHINAHRLTLLLGDGTGSFQIDRTIDTPYYPYCIEAVNLNGDNATDLGVGLLSGGQDNAIRMILSDGKGGYLPPVDSSFIRQPVDLAFADFNRDEILDCVSVDKHAGIATVMQGNGDGSFSSPQYHPFDGQPEEVEAFDVNNDGVADVVAAHSYFHRVTTMVGLGNGQFLFPVWQDVGPQANDLTHADFDGDGFMDLAVAHGVPGVEIVSVLLNRSIPGAAAHLLDVSAAVGVIDLGFISDIEHSDNAYLMASAHPLGSVRTPGLIDLRVAARTEEPNPALLNISVEAQISWDGIEQVRLLNRLTRHYDVVMQNPSGLGDRINRVLGVDARPYIGKDGEIELSLRHTTMTRQPFSRFSSFVDWVEIAVE